MITVDEALTRIKAECAALAPRRVALENALGRILAEDVASDIDSPPHDKSLMDGFAVRAADGLGDRTVLEEITAGQTPTQVVTAGTSVRIMTGAPIPNGADAVVMVERTETIDNQTVRIFGPEITPEQNIMRRGASLRAGDRVLQHGALLRPTEIGILAEVGRATPLVVPQPTVAIIATGDEIVPASEKPPAGAIRNSNGPMLTACVTNAGAAPVNLGIATDDANTLRTLIDRALDCDVVILSGGVSAGVLDLVPPALKAAGVRNVFHKVAMKPGKPTWFGVKEHADGRRTLVFGLPGNPVSGLVCFEVLARPAIAALAGFGFQTSPRMTFSLAEPLRHAGDRPTFRPAKVSGKQVAAVSWRGSADLASLAEANALIVLPAGETELPRGAIVEVVFQN